MQVVCGNCQLTFDAPEGTTGLVCPICRSPLHVEGGGANGDASKAASKSLEWNGGSLTDLIAILSAPAVSARVEVIPNSGHFPHKDHPQRFVRILHDFVRKTQPATHSRSRFRTLLKNGRPTQTSSRRVLSLDERRLGAS